MEDHNSRPTNSFKPINARSQSGSVNLDIAGFDYRYDFRTDECTIVTPSMIDSINFADISDDALVEDPTTREFQKYMATITSHQAALFVISIRLANKLALRLLRNPKMHTIMIVDKRSKLFQTSNNLAVTFDGAEVRAISPSNNHHITLYDILRCASDIHVPATIVICLENTLLGTVMPLDDHLHIHKWAKTLNPPGLIHLDGNTLWEAAASGSGTLEEYCRISDTVSLCLTRGVGAPTGAVLLGHADALLHARAMCHNWGVMIRTAAILTAPAHLAVREALEKGEIGAAQVNTYMLSQYWKSLGGELEVPCETNVLILKLQHHQKNRFIQLADHYRLRVTKGDLTGRIVLHKQICPDALDRMKALMEGLF